MIDLLSKRNVFEMTDYRTVPSFSPLGQVEAYWEALRGAALMPKRSQIDPRGIESTLEYTFILERIAIGMARMRIAGSHLSNLMGMEVRGMPLTSFITPKGRCQMGEVLEEVFQRPAVCELHLSAEVGRKKPEMDARMVLLPLTSDLGDVSRVLGCLVAQGKMGDQPRRFNILDAKIRPLGVEAKTELETQTTTAVTAPDAIVGFGEHQAKYEGKSKPYLRLVKTD